MTDSQAVTPPNTYQGPNYTRDVSKGPVGREPSYDHGFQCDPTLLAKLAKDLSPAMERLWFVYGQAKRDFQGDTGHNDKKQHDIAKFLRDTAENILEYIKDKHPDQRIIEELEASLQVADEAVTILHGGKKRKWDDPTSDGNTEWTLPARIPPPGRRDTNRDNRRGFRNRGARGELFRGDFPGHASALAQHQRSAAPRRNAMTELFPDEREPKRRRNNQVPKPQPGRGHSEIPFGYSRAVDSYQPGQ